MIETCPFCQNKLSPDNSPFPVGDYFKHQCHSCTIEGHSRRFTAFYLTQDGQTHQVIDAGLVVKDLKLWYQNDNPNSVIFKVRSVTNYSDFDIDAPEHDLTRPTYEKILDFPTPKLDLAQPINPQELYQKMKVWLTFS